MVSARETSGGRIGPGKTQRRAIGRLILATLIGLSAGHSVAQDTTANDPRVGKKILITKAAAELRTPQAVVWRAWLGEVFTVSLTNGPWLWITEKGGWLSEADCVLFDSAVEELTGRVTTSPTAENYHLRGVALLAHGKYNDAISDFTQSLSRRNDNAGAYNNRGQAYYFQQQWDRAISDFSLAVRVDPKHFVALNNRALAQIGKENYRAALRDLNQALAIQPEYAEALNNRGVVYQKLGDMSSSVRDFTAALKIDPKYADALGNRAHTRRLQKQYRPALADLEQALTIKPDMFEAANDLAWILSVSDEDSVRDPQRALELAKQACSLTEYANWNTLDTLAAANAEAGNFEEAQKWAATALELAPTDEKARVQRHLNLILAKQPIRD